MDTSGDMYRTLGVATSAEEGIIRAAYKHLAKTHHPDKGGDPARFLQIQTAYETLIDPTARARYDASIAARPSNTEATGPRPTATSYTTSAGAERPSSWIRTSTKYSGHMRDGDRVSMHFSKNPNHIPKITPKTRNKPTLHSSWIASAWVGAAVAATTYLQQNLTGLQQLASFTVNAVRGIATDGVAEDVLSTMLLWGVAGWVLAAGTISCIAVHLGRGHSDTRSSAGSKNLTYLACALAGWGAATYLPRPEVAIAAGALAYMHARNVSRRGAGGATSSDRRARG
jgi:hypothetical protein